MALSLRAVAWPVPDARTSRTATRLRAALLGYRAIRLEIAAEDSPVPRVGGAIESVSARGSHLEIGFDDRLVLHTHLGRSGRWDLYRPGESWRRRPSAARAVIEVRRWTAVCFSPRSVEVHLDADRRRHPGVGSLGPDLSKLGPDLDECLARMERFCDPHDHIGDVMADQRIATGIGNIYKSEALWLCRIDPSSALRLIDDVMRARLLETASRMVLAHYFGGERATATGGLAVYGRAGKPCLRCNSPIRVERLGDQARVTYWCPGCQRRPMPTPRVVLAR